MTSLYASVVQAAVEYGATSTGVSSGFQGSMSLLESSARDGWRVISSQPATLVGGVLILFLLYLFFRSPVR